MQRALIFGFHLLFGLSLFAQVSEMSPENTEEHSFFEKDTRANKGRLIGVSSSIGTVWTGSIIGLRTIWYDQSEEKKFTVFDDSRNWLQMDKAGHVYAAYHINRLASDLYQWSGLNYKTSAWIGFGVSLGYQTTFEILDGFSPDYGWSWSDVAANALGSTFYTTQELIWQEQRILPKFSYHPTEFAALRPAVLGSNFSESLLKDYNGQTYWLSFSPGSFFKNSKIPKWACISLGYSAHEKIVGSEATYFDNATGITYHEQREFLLSLDIDFSQLNIKRPWLKVLVQQLNYLKIPFPALMIRDGNLTARPFYF